MKNLLVATILLGTLSGCTYLRSQVAVFHQLPKDFSGSTYAMIPFKEQQVSLEHKAYEEGVRQELNAKGFRETPVDQAQIVVFLAYGIDTGKEVVSSYPIIGQTGVSSSSTYGTIQSYGGYSTYPGTTTYTPTYGVVGTGVTSQTQYTRVFRLDMLDKQALAAGTVKKLYEGKVVSRGSSSQLAEVLPTMVKALFENFPGQNGSTRTSTRALQ
jgi:Domain of unknown function (DUF4136)